MKNTIDTIAKAIEIHVGLSLEYKGNAREFIPQVLGVRRNGKIAVLGHKKNADGEFSLRLYNLSGIESPKLACVLGKPDSTGAKSVSDHFSEVIARNDGGALGPVEKVNYAAIMAEMGLRKTNHVGSC